jgi:hypothetical protein
MQRQDDYFAAYRSLKLTRGADGVLVVEFHSKGGPFRFTAQDHTEFVDAFYRIAQARQRSIWDVGAMVVESSPERGGSWAQDWKSSVRPRTTARTARSEREVENARESRVSRYR